MATGRTGEPEWPLERKGKIIVHDVHTLSDAILLKFEFWIWWMLVQSKPGSVIFAFFQQGIDAVAFGLKCQ